MREWAARLPCDNRLGAQLEAAGERLLGAIEVLSLADLDRTREGVAGWDETR